MTRSLTLTEYLRNVIGILVFVIAFIIIIPIILLLVVITFGKATDWIIRTFGPAIARPVFALLGIRYKKLYHGEAYDGPAVVIMNHSSTLDIPAMMAVGMDKIRFVAKWELQYIPFFWAVGRLTGQVFIKRQKSEHAVHTLKKTYERLKRDQLSVMIAPEGTRKHKGVIGPFKKGAFRVAMDLGYPIIPIYFEGNRELSPSDRVFTKSGTITAHIHPPIETTNWKRETLDEHIAEVRGMYLKWAGVTQDECEHHATFTSAPGIAS